MSYDHDLLSAWWGAVSIVILKVDNIFITEDDLRLYEILIIEDITKVSELTGKPMDVSFLFMVGMVIGVLVLFIIINRGVIAFAKLLNVDNHLMKLL